MQCRHYAVLALAAAVAASTVGGLCWRSRRRNRRRLPKGDASRRSHRRSRRSKESPSALSSDWLRQRLTVVLTTSPVGRHPSTDLIDEVIGSFKLIEGLEHCDLIIVCDGYRDTNPEGLPYKEPKFRSGIVDAEAAANYEAYKARLRERMHTGVVPSLQVLELSARCGFGFAVKAALDLVSTPYVLVVQHDRPFVRACDLARVVAAMEADAGRLKYVGLPTSTTVMHQYHVLSKYGIRLAAFDVDERGLQMLPLIQWYDSTHICETEHYRTFVFGPQKLVVKGGFIEDKLGQAQLAAIRKDGVEAAHPAFGTFLACGDGFFDPCVAHLDGRDPLNGSKFRHTQGEDLLGQEAEDLARSATSGETVPVGIAAARAAEAARIRVTESMRPQAERGRPNGKLVEAKVSRPVERVPIPVPKEAWLEYYVDNGQLKANTPGLGFRISKNLDDRAPDDSSVPWNTTVMGVDLGDGWVRVHGGRFLPTHLGGCRVLSAADGLHRDSVGPPPPPPPPPPQPASRPSHGGHTIRAPPARMPTPMMPSVPTWAPPPPLGPVPFSLPPMVPPGHVGGPPLFVPGAHGPPLSASSLPKPKAVGQHKAKVQVQAQTQAQALAQAQAKLQLAGKDMPAKDREVLSTAKIWEYIDPKGNIQGPFRLMEMQHWHSKGYFPKDLPVRCNPKDVFVELEQMFPAPQSAFKARPKRPSSAAGG